MMRKIGVITNDENGVFQKSVINGAWTTAEVEDCELLIHSQANNTLPKLTPDEVDGWLVIANAATPEWLAAVKSAGKPVTLVSHTLPGFPSVVFDNRQGMMELVKHLVLTCGRREFIFVRGVTGQHDADQREAAFTDALMRYSAHAAGTINGEFNPKTAVAALETLIKEGNAFDAVIASDYMMALGVIARLKQQQRVPQDVSVVGFGDGPEARAAKLTTVAADVEELGRRAAKQVVHQMNGGKISGVTTLSVRLIERNTSYDDPPDPGMRKEKPPRFVKRG